MRKIVFLYLILILILGAVILFRSGFLKPSIKQDAPQITVNNQAFELILAKTDEELVNGLSSYDKLDANKGMLFVFPQSNYYGFWMKNMKFPIDIIYINDNKIVDVYENAQPPQDNSNAEDVKIYKPRDKANYVLEVPAGSAKQGNIKAGDTVTIKNVE